LKVKNEHIGSCWQAHQPYSQQQQQLFHHTRSPLYFSLGAALAPFPWEMTLRGVTTSQPERERRRRKSARCVDGVLGPYSNDII